MVWDRKLILGQGKTSLFVGTIKNGFSCLFFRTTPKAIRIALIDKAIISMIIKKRVFILFSKNNIPFEVSIDGDKYFNSLYILFLF